MQNVRNTLRALEAVAELQPVGVSELARNLNLPKSTVQRTLQVLHDSGWLRPVGTEIRRWELTNRILHVARHATADLGLRDAALPVMEDLRRRTEETIHLMVPREDVVVLVERLDTPKPVRIEIPLGKSAPLHTVSNGKAILATMDAERLEELLSGELMSYTETTITDPAELRNELAAIRERGYATNGGEWRSDIAAVASAILDGDGSPVAGISISTPRERMPEETQRRYGQLVAEAASTITASLTGPRN